MSGSAPSKPPLLAAALRYTRNGWRIIPLQYQTTDGECTCQRWRDQNGRGSCPNPGKHPRFKGFANRTTTEEHKLYAIGLLPRAEGRQVRSGNEMEALLPERDCGNDRWDVVGSLTAAPSRARIAL